MIVTENTERQLHRDRVLRKEVLVMWLNITNYSRKNVIVLDKNVKAKNGYAVDVENWRLLRETIIGCGINLRVIEMYFWV